MALGLQMLKAGKARGVKFVYRIENAQNISFWRLQLVVSLSFRSKKDCDINIFLVK
jgi:hypothetical protein